MVRRYVVTELMFRLVMASRVRERETLRTYDVTNAVGGGTVPVYVPGTQGTVDALDHLGTDDHQEKGEGPGPLHRTEGGDHHQEEDIHLALEAAHHPGVHHLAAQLHLLVTPLPERGLLESTDVGPGHHEHLDHQDIGEGLLCLQGPALLSQPALLQLDLLLQKRDVLHLRDARGPLAHLALAPPRPPSVHPPRGRCQAVLCPPLGMPLVLNQWRMCPTLLHPRDHEQDSTNF